MSGAKPEIRNQKSEASPNDEIRTTNEEVLMNRRQVCVPVVLFLLCSSMSMAAAPTTRAVPATLPAKRPGIPRIALAGDSTVTDTAGWGTGFAKALGDKV